MEPKYESAMNPLEFSCILKILPANTLVTATKVVNNMISMCGLNGTFCKMRLKKILPNINTIM